MTFDVRKYSQTGIYDDALPNPVKDLDGLRLARAAAAVYAANGIKVYMFETVRSTPGLKPVTAEVRDLFRRPLLPLELKNFDAVVFDPPRQGAEAQAAQLAASKVPLVVGVSCDPVTFARDARLLGVDR